MSDTGFPRGDGIPASAGGGAPTGPAGGDLAGTYPDPTIGLLAVTAANIANETITDVQVAPANKDGLAAVASLRTLGTGALQATAGNDARVVGALQAANNLSDLTNVVTARASLGLGSAATQPSGAFDPAGAAAAVTAASIGALLASNNLSDLTNAATARSNLGAAADTLVVHLAGIETVTGVKTFSAGIILAATIAMGGFAITGMANPTLPQDAATKAYVDSLVPAAYTAGTGLTLTGTQFAIDATVATLTGSQTLTNKTLTTPTINGAALSGVFSGDHFVSGIATFTSPPAFAIDDATTNNVTDTASFVHTTSGTPAVGIAAGITFGAENISSIVAIAARVAGRLTGLTNGAENGALDLYVMSAGTVTRRAFLGPDGGFVIGTGTVALGVEGIGLLQNIPLYGGNAANTGWNPMIQMQSGTQVAVGSGATSTQILGTSISFAAAISMGTFRITGMGNPSLAQDAATKAYVDSLVPAAYTAGTGLTLTGTQFAIDATVATLTGSQTLTNKVLTSPTINAATLSGVIAGAHTVSGIATFTAVPIGLISDAATNTVVYPWVASHLTSGTPATGFGSAYQCNAQNSASASVPVAAFGGVITTTTSGSEVGAATAYYRTGGAWIEGLRIHGSGAVSIGNTDDSGVAGDFTWGNGSAATHRLRVSSVAGLVTLVSMATACQIGPVGGSYALTLFTSAGTKIHMQTAATDLADWSDDLLVLGRDGGASGVNYNVRAMNNASGTNTAGALLTFTSGLGRGTGAVSYISLKGSITAASGTTAHTSGESARSYGQWFQTTAGVARKKSNVANAAYTVLVTDHVIAYTSLTAAQAVTLLAPGSGGATATSPRYYEVKDESGSCGVVNTITLSVSGGANIDGVATLVINSAYGKVTVYDNGTAYFVS